MSVPEAAMDKNDFPPRWKNQIRMARQRSNMEPIAVSKAMDELTNDHFRPGIPGTDSGHVERSSCRSEMVNHTR
jgi:hypothetical protein